MGHYTATTKNRCDSLPQHDAPPVTDAAQLPSVKHPEVGEAGTSVGPVVKNPPCNAGKAGLIPGQGTKIPRAPGQQSPR